MENISYADLENANLPEDWAQILSNREEEISNFKRGIIEKFSPENEKKLHNAHMILVNMTGYENRSVVEGALIPMIVFLKEDPRLFENRMILTIPFSDVLGRRCLSEQTYDVYFEELSKEVFALDWGCGTFVYTGDFQDFN